MEFEFLNPPAIVQEKKKYQTFTITPIDDIVKWREQQAAKEAVYRIRLGERDRRLAAFEAEFGQKLDAPKVLTRNWEEKLAHALEERARLAQAEEQVTIYPPWEPAPPPKKTLKERFFSFIKNIWDSANFSNHV